MIFKKQRQKLHLTGTLFSILSILPSLLSAQGWKMQPVPVQTRWAKKVGPDNALKEYPRPQLTRSNWTNLNGLWDYAITGKDTAQPQNYQGQILVPYPIESALSGVKKALQPDQNLWYKRTVSVNAKPGERTLLHFGAVDWQATVYVNGKEAGRHTGGYTAFTLDITDKVHSGSNEFLVKVYDPTDQGIGPHGKQVLSPQNIYYTATSGIWQTVWLERVPATYITDIKLTPEIDHSQLNLSVSTNEQESSLTYEAIADENGKKIAEWHSIHNAGDLSIPAAHLWSPSDPFLYGLTVRIKQNGKVVDEVKSYFGMRKISIGKDEKGIDRICLNNKPYYNLGTLDQGFWPDGLYTAPTDEALAFDIKAIKAMGFNTIRKHIKVEPARWYYWADKLGMLVWQDFVNPNQSLPEGSKPEFEREAAEELSQLQNNPSITTWVLFNEKWGQFDQKRLTEWVKQSDPSRLVNGHTGELLYVNEKLRSPSPDAYVSADMTDVHSYPDPMMPIKQTGKAQVLGEFGGIGVFIPDHQWNSSSAWGYVQEKPAALKTRYRIMNHHLELLKEQGLSGSIYTQPFDVEGEQNGLMTYDREVVKIPFTELRMIHAGLNLDLDKTTIPAVMAKEADTADPDIRYSDDLDEYIKGNRDAGFLKRLAMEAVQSGDKPGAEMAGEAYVQTLKGQLSTEDIQAVAQFTKSTKGAGFRLMITDSAQFKQVLGEAKYRTAMMNMIYHGEMEVELNGTDKPDWVKIGERVKVYGKPGEEIYLRAKTVAYYNAQDWENYKPAAREYLAKYGADLSEHERTMFQQAVDQH